MTIKSEIRVRMAPSPTGYLHVGTLRTTLFNWLFAKHNNGSFLLRIEDTDLERSKEEYTISILESLKWVGINPDEPIVIQSKRIERHIEVANQLLSNNKAYKCYCTSDELVARLGASAADDGYAKYDRLCLNKKVSENKPYVIRFKIPDNIHEISFEDLIHGQISFNIDQLDDFIIVRSDGSPMYNFVVIVDDADMKISHILRGDDHVSNTPKQILLYQACDFELPKFGHIPMVLGPDGQKLSKRHAATAVIDYRKNGFLAEALCNYLVRLGWSHGDQEIFSKEQLIELFSIDKIGKKSSIFDLKKLEWLNGLYIRQKSGQEILDLILRDIDENFENKLSDLEKNKIIKLIDLYKDRVKTLKELIEEIYLFYNGSESYEAADLKKDNIVLVKDILEKTDNFESENLSNLLKNFCKEKNIAMVEIAQPLRVALIGKGSSPSIFELLGIIGKKKSLARLDKFIKIL